MYTSKKDVDNLRNRIEEGLHTPEGVVGLIETVDVPIKNHDVRVNVVSNAELNRLAGYDFSYPVISLSHEDSSLDDKESYVIAVGETVRDLELDLKSRQKENSGLALIVGYEALGFIGFPDKIKKEENLSVEDALYSKKTLQKALNWEIGVLKHSRNSFVQWSYLNKRETIFYEVLDSMAGNSSYDDIIDQVRRNKDVVSTFKQGAIRAFSPFINLR